jgi:4-amino-4-deoxy-L-arabinose transferase-like glycosyltransferase
VLAVLFTARRVFSTRAAWMAASVMASSCGYFLAGQFITLDIGLTSLLTCALCAFLLAQRDGVPVREERRWMLVAWAACALAVLIKGAIGAVIPAMALVTYVLIARDFAVLRRLHIGLGLLLFALLTVPWFVAVELDNPGFNHFFFVTEHFQRFTQPEHNRRGPWWYFIPVAVLLLTPWGPAIVAAAVRRLPSTAVRPANGFRVQWFLWCWAGAIFLFFSLSSSKLPAYILPAIGAVVLAMAVPLARRWDATVRITAWTLIASGVVVAIGALPAGNLIKVALVRQSYADSIGWMIAAGIFFAVGGALALLLLRRRQRIAALGAMVVCILVACQLGVVVAHKVDGYFSAERLIERVIGNERPFHPDVPFYSVGWFDHTVPFYLGRTVALVGDKGELASDLAAVPSNYVKTEAMFVAEWNALREAYAIMPPGLYDRLRGEGVPMRFIDTDGRRVIVSRH